MECIWYISGFRRPWEAAVVGNLAVALGAGGEFSPRVYAESGTANFRVEGVLSWKSLTFFERAVIVLFKGRLWHLWGDAPFWWGWVRLRARTLHTSLDVQPQWRGHPTRLFAEQVQEGESRIIPSFEIKVAWTDREGSPTSVLLLALQPDKALDEALKENLKEIKKIMEEVLPEGGVEGIAIDGSEMFQSELLKKCRVLFIDDSPSNALLAAYLTMQGVPVITRDGPLSRSVLGPGGYLTLQGGAKEDWRAVLQEALSEKGRSTSASARRFLKENYSVRGATETLTELYRSVAASSVSAARKENR
ncbi:MAG: hypothetical protein LBJ36_08185 [Synergistaceae bacterium]|jgi:hypothetical protein|nr:hypothetical protein [Synergistaceae bacterium]